MKIVKKVTIAAPAADVWKILGNDFVKADLWMAGIKNSIEIKEGNLVKNAPVIGRRAEVGAFPGSYLDEIITEYNPSTTNLTVQTTLVNGSKGTPLKGYCTKMTVRLLEDNKSEMIWSSDVQIGILGYPFYFAIKKSSSAGFLRNIEELKHFVETGKPNQHRLDTRAKWSDDAK